MSGLRSGNYGVDYGINAFYLAKTKVSGDIIQEHLHTNLAYNYYISHLPVYAFIKAFVETNYHNMAVTVDAGVGPNFMDANLYADSSLDGITVPDNAFSGNHTKTVFSAMIGIGLKCVLMSLPVEIGYRYFYLGEGQLSPRTNQIQNNLKTGNTSAQALMVTVSV